MGHLIFFDALSFTVDDSAWLQEAPLDVEPLPRRGATHFRAGTRGVLLLQQSAPLSACTSVMRRNKRSRSPRLQRWVQHARARQIASSQVAVLESLWLPRVPSARARFRLSSLPSTQVAGLQQKYTWTTPMKIPVKLAGASARSAKHPVHAVHLAVLPVGTLGGATWSCSAHLSSTWLRLPRLPIPSSRLIQRQEGESSRSELLHTRLTKEFGLSAQPDLQ
ncbi:hypothetical protein ZWY2020_054329 [Hordeum vulgare]|nr:hypothetical protein ZWY2020_054329 [Hordeum vulgare]